MHTQKSVTDLGSWGNPKVKFLSNEDLHQRADALNNIPGYIPDKHNTIDGSYGIFLLNPPVQRLPEFDTV